MEVGFEGERSTLESTGCCSGGGDGGTKVITLGATEVENNHTGKPMVNPGKDKVSRYGVPTFPKEGKGVGFPSGGTPWSVDSGTVVIEDEKDPYAN